MTATPSTKPAMIHSRSPRARITCGSRSRATTATITPAATWRRPLRSVEFGFQTAATMVAPTATTVGMSA
jgi:hypothetical protein